MDPTPFLRTFDMQIDHCFEAIRAGGKWEYSDHLKIWGNEKVVQLR
jgi:hypothetical protein